MEYHLKSCGISYGVFYEILWNILWDIQWNTIWNPRECHMKSHGISNELLGKKLVEYPLDDIL
jgi:hypothetical protein